MRGLEAGAVVDVRDQALRGVPLHRNRVAIEVMKSQGEECEHHQKPDFPAGRERHTGDVLRDEDAERIDASAAPADAVGDPDHAHGDQAVHAHCE